MRLLIVEDEPDQLSALAQLFREEQFTVDTAADGNVGLLLGSANRYDLIILDWMLPGIDGHALLGELRKHIATPILLLTARDAVDDRVAGLRGGADDYLTKPFSIAELLARAHALLRRNEHVIAAVHPDSGNSPRAVVKALSPLDSARQVQQRLMPAALPDLPSVDVAFDYRPAQWVSGDYCDVWVARDGRLAFVVADVSGKGVHAAMIMAGVHAAIHASSVFCDSPAEIVAHLNQHLSRHLPSGMFVTLFLGLLDVASGRCDYVNAGHMPPLLLDAEGRATFFAPPSAMVLGVSIASYEVDTQLIPPGACVVAFTDGVTEAVGANGELFGTSRLRDAVAGGGRAEAASLVGRVTQAVSDFRRGALPHDDLTVLAVRWLGAGVSVEDGRLQNSSRGDD